MLDDVVEILACPRCGDALVRAQQCLRCAQGHSFDVARQGYVSLLPPRGRAPRGDTSAMIADRVEFLRAGHYAELTARIVEQAVALTAAGNDRSRQCVVDVGAGTGHYLAALLGRLPDATGLALDASKYACRRAARAHERMGAVVADVWRELPVQDDVASTVLNVFAPRNPAEMHRVLCQDGHLVVATPDSDHLGELVAALGMIDVDARKPDRLDEQLGGLFSRVASRTCRFTMCLGHADVLALVGMGPSAWHADPASWTERVAALPDPVAVTASVTISAYRPRDGACGPDGGLGGSP